MMGQFEIGVKKPGKGAFEMIVIGLRPEDGGG